MALCSGEILSDNKRGLMLPYGEDWRKWRKVLHNGFHSRRAETYNEIQTLESAVLMHQLLTEPTKYERHLQRYGCMADIASLSGVRL